MSAPASETEASSSATSAGSTIVPLSVREIHKNGWLKRLPQTDRRPNPFGKIQKPEKMWIVFCIHDDVEAFLEYYENRRSAYSHRPTVSVPLANCLHISPNIVVQENDFVFSITMDNHAIKLAASTREQMTEWIDTLRGKLTELGVLSPPNNLYSRGPEVKPVLAPSRDPNSPLPPPPPLASIPIGTEPPVNNNRPQQQISRNQENTNTYVVPLELPATQPRNSSPNRNTGSPRSSQSSPFLRHSPTTPPLPTFRGESENRASVAPSPTTTTTTTQFSFDALVSPTTSITAMNAYTNVNSNSRNETSDPIRTLPDQNGNNSTGNDIYEPLCLASTATPSYMNAVPNQNYNGGRQTYSRPGNNQPRRMPLVANDIARNPLRPRAHSEDRNINLVASNDHTDHQTTNGNAVVNAEHDGENSRPMTLKEKQVFQLCCEMSHKAGVRLTLPKRDCINSIAFAEHLGNLWICGWKQRDHPLLYHSFHIGDRVLSVAGHKINSIHDFNRVLKAENNSKMEFVIGRLPFGKAIAIRREREGQDLGIVREGNTAEIVEVTETGLAARHGLPPKSQSADGHAPCNWMLTEINGRSLNLFFKDCEIQDRLNAVGKDISILVQPSDFVKVLKKQLRAMWNYKDYIVQ